ncbi:MAG: hypothetical protein E6J73_07810 [Deltaproteobacteria bacterium]|nr:MAG: hypothetical protein E6J73_07810 [Deltaproteobacteria bacterium]
MQVFSVLSYNIHECVGSDRQRNPARIAEVINRSGAQIIGLQEVHSDASGTEELHQMNYLAAATGLQAIPGPAVERRNGHYGNVLLTSYKVLAVHNACDRHSPWTARARAALSGETTFACIVRAARSDCHHIERLQ